MESEAACISPLSQTFLYGFGVYEGVRSYRTEKGVAIFRLQDHTDRLFQSAKLLFLDIPYTKAYLNRIQCEILDKGKLGNAYLRPVVFLGSEFLGLHSKLTSVHVMIAAFKWDKVYLTEKQQCFGVTLKTSSYERAGMRNGLHKAKINGMYFVAMLANNEARMARCEEALMLDHEGYVVEGSGANIFIVKDGQLYTPNLEFVLDGITRRTVIDIAKEKNLTLIETRLTSESVYGADEVFFTGTAAEILPIVEIDGKKIADGQVGRITKGMQQTFFNIVQAKETHYQHHLTFLIDEIKNKDASKEEVING